MLKGAEQSTAEQGSAAVMEAREEEIEEIQLDYRRIKCIFNHNAVFPDVTVKPL